MIGTYVDFGYTLPSKMIFIRKNKSTMINRIEQTSQLSSKANDAVRMFIFSVKKEFYSMIIVC